MPLLLVPSKMLMQVQDLQPLAMRDSLPRAIRFFLHQLSTRPFAPGAESLDEKFLVRALTFLRNALSTSAYMPRALGQAVPEAQECQQVLHAFFASPSLPQLVGSLLTRALPLSADEYEEYAEDPEAFVYEEHLARESDSRRLKANLLALQQSLRHRRHPSWLPQLFTNAVLVRKAVVDEMLSCKQYAGWTSKNGCYHAILRRKVAI